MAKGHKNQKHSDPNRINNIHVVNFILLILSLLPLHEGHEVAGEEGEMEDADLLGEGDDNLLLGREGFHVVSRDDHRHALSERPPNTLVRILQIPVYPEQQEESADAEVEVEGRAQYPLGIGKKRLRDWTQQPTMQHARLPDEERRLVQLAVLREKAHERINQLRRAAIEHLRPHLTAAGCADTPQRILLKSIHQT